MYSIKRTISLCWAVLLLGMVSCNNTKMSTQEEQSTAPAPSMSTAGNADTASSGQEEALTYWRNKNCPRGVPEQTLGSQNPNLVHIDYVLTKDGSYEAAQLFNGDSLYIESTGCDFYKLTYLLRSYNPKAAQGDAKFWFGKASDIFLALQDSKVPFDYQNLSGMMQALLQQNDVVIGKEYPLPPNGKAKSYIQIEETGKLPNGKGGYMRLKLFIGPF